MEIQEQIEQLITQLVDEAVTNMHLRTTDSVQAFIDEYLKPSEGESISLGVFHRAYAEFCVQHKYQLIAVQQIAPNLRKKGLSVTPGRYSRHYIRGYQLTWQPSGI